MNERYASESCRRAGKRRWSLRARVFAGILVGMGLVLLLPALYVVWFVTGKAHVTVDYAPIVNRMSQSPVPGADNAWSCYEQAFALYVEPNDEIRRLVDTARDGSGTHPASTGLDPNQERAIRDWVEGNAEAWQQFLMGGDKRYFYLPYDLPQVGRGERPWLWQTEATHLGEVRDFACLGIWRSRLAAREGMLRTAFQECLALMRASVHWQRRMTLTEQLVGSATGSLAHEQVLQILTDSSLPATDLAWLQEEMAQVYAGGFMPIHHEGDRICLLDTVQHVFTEGGWGEGHVIPRELSHLFGFWGNVDYWGEPPEGRLQCLTLSMAHVGRDEFLAKAFELYDRADQVSQMTPYQCRRTGGPTLESMVESLDKRKYALIWLMLPAAERVSNLTFGHKALHDGTVLALALRRWHIEKGSYPSELGMLVEGQYLGELPVDPFGDGPPVYKLTDDGFILYSLGLNFTDDGGKPAMGEAGRPRLFAGGGDIVIWPPVYVP